MHRQVCLTITARQGWIMGRAQLPRQPVWRSSLYAEQRRWLKRRQAVEPHRPYNHGMRRCWLKGKSATRCAQCSVRWDSISAGCCVPLPVVEFRRDVDRRPAGAWPDPRQLRAARSDTGIARPHAHAQTARARDRPARFAPANESPSLGSLMTSCAASPSLFKCSTTSARSSCPLPNSSRFAPARVRDLLSQTGTTGATKVTTSELLTVAGCVLRLSSPEQYRLDGREGLVRPTFKINRTPQSLAC